MGAWKHYWFPLCAWKLCYYIALSWKSTCQNCLFDWGPPLAKRSRGKQKSYNSQLASEGSIGPLIKLIMWCSCFSQNWITMMTQNWNGYSMLHQRYIASDFRGFRGLERNVCTDVWICRMMTRITTHPSFEWYTHKPVRGKPRWV